MVAGHAPLNQIWIQGDEVLTRGSLRGGDAVPLILVHGSDGATHFSGEHSELRRQLAAPYSQLFDATTACGAILYDLNQLVVILGFDRWYPGMWGTSTLDDLSEYQTFHRDGQKIRVFLDIVQPVWTGWTIHFADHRSFGMAGRIESDLSRISLMNTVERGHEKSDSQIRSEFRVILPGVMGRHFAEVAQRLAW